MRIELAKYHADYEVIENLAREIIPDFYAGIIPHDHNLFFVEKFQTARAIEQQISNGFEYYLIRNTEVVPGYFGIQVDTENRTMLLSKLYLLKQYRGSGYGTKAMDFIIHRAKELGLNKIVLTVNRENDRTINLYHKYGFHKTKDLVNQFENGHTILDYEMTKEMH